MCRLTSWLLSESGLTRVHRPWGMVCRGSIERAGCVPYVGFSIDVRYPKEVLDVVRPVYADVEVWTQQAHGAQKDPYRALTSGRITRQDTIESAALLPQYK